MYFFFFCYQLPHPNIHHVNVTIIDNDNDNKIPRRLHPHGSELRAHHIILSRHNLGGHAQESSLGRWRAEYQNNILSTGYDILLRRAVHSIKDKEYVIIMSTDCFKYSP